MRDWRSFARAWAPPALHRAWQCLRPPPSDAEIFGADPFFQRHGMLNRGIAPDEIVIRNGLKLGLGPESRVHHEQFCFRSREMIEELDGFLAVMRGKSRLLDVGALHGIFSLVFTCGRPEASALAVEPSPAAFPFLLYNLHRNPTCAVRPLEDALSGQSGPIVMEGVWQHLVATDPAAPPTGPRFSIAALSGDELCAREGFAPDLIKVDVEGHELQCLQGLEETIRAQRPTICLEIHPEALRAQGRSAADVATWARAQGCTLHRPDLTRCVEGEVAALTEVGRFLVQPEGVPFPRP